MDVFLDRFWRLYLNSRRNENNKTIKNIDPRKRGERQSKDKELKRLILEFADDIAMVSTKDRIMENNWKQNYYTWPKKIQQLE